MYSRALKHYKEFLEKNSQESHTQQQITSDANNIIFDDIQKLLTKEMLEVVRVGGVRIEYNELSNNLKRKYNQDVNPHTQIPHLIGPISEVCFQLNLPLLSVVVVNKESQKPGQGFFKLYKKLYLTQEIDQDRLLKDIKNALLTCNEWYKLTEYLGISIEGIKRPKKKYSKNTEIEETEITEEIKYQEEAEKIKISGDISSNTELKPVEKKSKENLSQSACYYRSAQIAKEAIILSDYNCEIHTSHRTFISKITKKNFVEVHHLIPMCYEEYFQYSLDVRSNIIAICPNCHRKLHSSIFEDKQNILTNLYNKRITSLNKQGIYLELNEFWDLYK